MALGPRRPTTLRRGRCTLREGGRARTPPASAAPRGEPLRHRDRRPVCALPLCPPARKEEGGGGPSGAESTQGCRSCRTSPGPPARPALLRCALAGLLGAAAWTSARRARPAPPPRRARGAPP
ncbi:hypothetical protein PVAP13_6NG135606 [Panicum virgatum]|uniref:Uncharacterized protein n=1 Tax=Panicum virgatum TaxID=38727 RepID=A0A8T0R0T8_PANVG|nr:hypothetical protein PVAP13_6NG135606 [Panicum virgatum]